MSCRALRPRPHEAGRFASTYRGTLSGDKEMRILLMMDGDRGFLDAVERAARSLGFAVFVAETEPEFQRLYRRHSPDVILLGIVMPEVDGFEVTAWLCEQGAAARLLLVSTHNPLYAKWLKHLAEVNGGLSVEVLQEPMDETDLIAALEGQAGLAVPRRIQEGNNDDNDTVPPRGA